MWGDTNVDMKRLAMPLQDLWNFYKKNTIRHVAWMSLLKCHFCQQPFVLNMKCVLQELKNNLINI